MVLIIHNFKQKVFQVLLIFFWIKEQCQGFADAVYGSLFYIGAWTRCHGVGIHPWVTIR